MLQRIAVPRYSLPTYAAPAFSIPGSIQVSVTYAAAFCGQGGFSFPASENVAFAICG